MIRQSIDSVLSQTYEPFELIVVDDRSTDATQEVVQAIDDPRIRLAENEGPKGPSGARNFGVRLARGTLIGFLDSDDEWHSRKLEVQVPALEENHDIDAIGCGWRWLNKRTGNLRIERVPDPQGRIDGLPRWAYNICPDLLVRRRAIEATPFNEGYTAYECLEWVVRLARNYRYTMIPDVLVDCYDHEGERASDGKLRCLEALASVVADHEEFIRSDQRAWSELNSQLGAGLLVTTGNRKRSRAHLLRALQARPKSMRTWAYGGLACIPFGDHLTGVLRGVFATASRDEGGEGG